MTLFLAFFNLTVGNITFIYTAEVAVDKAAGIALAFQFVSMTQISLTVEYMIDGFFQVHGTFLYFGTICLVGCLFSWCCLKETRGLTDIQKKSLFSGTNLSKVL